MNNSKVCIVMSRHAARLVFELVDAEIERIDMELCRQDLNGDGRITDVELQLLLEVRRRLAEEAHGTFIRDADLDPGQNWGE